MDKLLELPACCNCGRKTKHYAGTLNMIGYCEKCKVYTGIDGINYSKTSPPDLVKNPSHYCVNGYECSIVAEAIGLVDNAYLFNIFKYIWRASRKGNEKQDLEKIIQYAKMRISQIESANKPT